jgi:hypothetical protein
MKPFEWIFGVSFLLFGIWLLYLAWPRTPPPERHTFVEVVNANGELVAQVHLSPDYPRAALDLAAGPYRVRVRDSQDSQWSAWGDVVLPEHTPLLVP